jgi:hypothetical protein
MNTTSVGESDGKSTSTLYLYLEHLYYLACGSSHLYGGGLSLRLFSLHFKLSKGSALKPKTSLKRWFGPQVTWLALQVDLAYIPSYPKMVPTLCDNFLEAFTT